MKTACFEGIQRHTIEDDARQDSKRCYEQRKYGSSKLHWCLISVWWVVQFSKALNRFQKEDPTFRVSLDPDSGQVSACYFLRLLPLMQNT
jgi:hypothetical protein